MFDKCKVLCWTLSNVAAQAGARHEELEPAHWAGHPKCRHPKTEMEGMEELRIRIMNQSWISYESVCSMYQLWFMMMSVAIIAWMVRSISCPATWVFGQAIIWQWQARVNGGKEMKVKRWSVPCEFLCVPSACFASGQSIQDSKSTSILYHVLFSCAFAKLRSGRRKKRIHLQTPSWDHLSTRTTR